MCSGGTGLPACFVSLPAVGAQGLGGQMLAQLFRGSILSWDHGAALGFCPLLVGAFWVLHACGAKSDTDVTSSILDCLSASSESQ